ncbi:MAG TPA: membrane-binding protein [Flavobacterium sp.]
MKKYIFIAAVLFTGFASAQSVQPKLEAYGEMVKATYYHENGSIQQQGFFKEGKLDGQWVSYDVNGNKLAVAEYSKGVKTGKWVFWNDLALNEVSYADNKVTTVKKWKQEAVVNRN